VPLFQGNRADVEADPRRALALRPEGELRASPADVYHEQSRRRSAVASRHSRERERALFFSRYRLDGNPGVESAGDEIPGVGRRTKGGRAYRRHDVRARSVALAFKYRKRFQRPRHRALRERSRSRQPLAEPRDEVELRKWRGQLRVSGGRFKKREPRSVRSDVDDAYSHFIFFACHPG